MLGLLWCLLVCVLAAIAPYTSGHLQTYAFWNWHEPEQGEFHWSGGANISAFVEVRRRGPHVIFSRHLLA